MISNPNLVYYACIAKGSVILAEFSSKEPGIESLAAKCVERAPLYHAMFSQTVRNRSYTFLIGDSLTFFGIFDENMDSSEAIWFLNRLRRACDDLICSAKIDSLNDLGSYCLQSQFDSIYAEIMDMEDLDLVVSPRRSMDGEVRNPSWDSSKSTRSSKSPLLGKSLNFLKKKKKWTHSCPKSDGSRDFPSRTTEKSVDYCGDGGNGVLCRDLKNGLLHGSDYHRQKAKQIWRKHVFAVLFFDLFVCALLFAIWLWVCRGFQCIEG